MFFGDPRAAFAHIARALRPGGRLVLLVWQPFPRNEWIVEHRLTPCARLEAPDGDPLHWPDTNVLLVARRRPTLALTRGRGPACEADAEGEGDGRRAGP